MTLRVQEMDMKGIRREVSRKSSKESRGNDIILNKIFKNYFNSKNYFKSVILDVISWELLVSMVRSEKGGWFFSSSATELLYYMVTDVLHLLQFPGVFREDVEMCIHGKRPNYLGFILKITNKISNLENIVLEQNNFPGRNLKDPAPGFPGSIFSADSQSNPVQSSQVQFSPVQGFSP